MNYDDNYDNNKRAQGDRSDSQLLHNMKNMIDEEGMNHNLEVSSDINDYNIEDNNDYNINYNIASDSSPSFDFSKLSETLAPKITIKESKTLTIDRGRRLKKIRLEYLKLSISKLACAIGIHVVNLRRLETAKTIIKPRIAEFLCIKFLERGLYVQYQWLMHGLGSSPQMLNNENMEEISNNVEYRQLTALFMEVNKCKKNQELISYDEYRNLSDSFISKVMNILYGQSYISCVINDKRMSPKYTKGMKVFGYWQSFDNTNYHLLNGFDCIVQRENNILMVRKVFYCDTNNCLILACHNTNYKPEIVSCNTPIAHIVLSLNYDKTI